MRRLLLLGSAVVFIDVAFFEAIVPLLPEYADDLGLSKAVGRHPDCRLCGGHAGGVAACGADGGALRTPADPALGPRYARAASLAFGFGASIVLLDAARFVQGVAGALAWSGALSWLILAAPEERRGAVIGNVLGRGRRRRAARPGARRAGARDRDRAGLRVHARRDGGPRDGRPTHARSTAGRASDDCARSSARSHPGGPAHDLVRRRAIDDVRRGGGAGAAADRRARRRRRRRRRGVHRRRRARGGDGAVGRAAVRPRRPAASLRRRDARLCRGDQPRSGGPRRSGSCSRSSSRSRSAPGSASRPRSRC